jgi:hypothetical protein
MQGHVEDVRSNFMLSLKAIGSLVVVGRLKLSSKKAMYEACLYVPLERTRSIQGLYFFLEHRQCAYLGKSNFGEVG